MKSWVIVNLFFLLGGCVSGAQINWNKLEEISPLITIEQDEYQKGTNYIGPPCGQPDCTQSAGDYVRLRAWKPDNSPETAYQIYVSDSYGKGWRFYEKAHDSDGKNMDIITISKHVTACGPMDCTFHELVGLNINRAYLQAHKSSGLRFQISGVGGKGAFSLPATYIVAFLNAVK
ncbi:MAG: hypothetical protein ACE5FY_07655 [Nitrospiria bacterium]